MITKLKAIATTLPLLALACLVFVGCPEGKKNLDQAGKNLSNNIKSAAEDADIDKAPSNLKKNMDKLGDDIVNGTK